MPYDLTEQDKENVRMIPRLLAMLKDITPKRGIDYFNKRDISDFLTLSTPIKGRDYFDGKDGKNGRDGIDGKDGEIGPRGPKGERGPKGDSGPKGDRGDKGRDGRDANDLSEKEKSDIVKPFIERHDKEYDHSLLHDPAMVGSVEVDESSKTVNSYLKFNGQKLVYSKPPKTGNVARGGGLSMRGGVRQGEIAFGAANNALDSEALFSYDKDNNIIDVPFIQFNRTLGEPAHSQGLMHWNEDDGTVHIGMAGSEVDLSLGQEMLIRGKATENISNGDMVYVSGASGSKPEFTKAIANDLDIANATLAMATEDISANSNGFVTTYGIVNDIDTSALSAGQTVYLSGDTAGAITSTEPTAPNYSVVIGYCLRSSATVGRIFVSINTKIWKYFPEVIPIVTKTADYTLTHADATVLFDASSEALTATLPAGDIGRRYVITKIDSSENHVTIVPNGSERIFGESSFSLEAQNECVQISFDGSNWQLAG